MCIKYSGQYVKKDIKNIFKIYAGIYYIDKEFARKELKISHHVR